MEISIIIINYNTTDFTCNCIKSIIEKTILDQYEIIVVENGSTDQGITGLKTRYPQVKVLESRVNLGFAKGINWGIEHASGKYILLLNSDTVLKNNAVDICYDFLNNHPDIGVVGSKLLNSDGTVQHSCQRFPAIRWKLVELFRIQKILPRKIGGNLLLGSFFSHTEIVYPDWIWGTFFLFRRKLLEFLPQKKLADDFFIYVEDVQWCKEFRLRNINIAFVPSAEVIHFSGMSGGDKSKWIENNMNKFMIKYYTGLHRRLIRIINFLLIGRFGYS